MPAYELNFDGIVGPTHNYAGLSRGNLASTRNAGSISNPRQAALEELAKMKFLAGLGVKQAVLPPQDRPDVAELRQAGFSGSDAEVLAAAAKENPALLVACSSASSMWAANAATVSPSADSADGRVHFTPANLASTRHRRIEAAQTAATLIRIFPSASHFVHHDPLPPDRSDEGAANHTRLCAAHGQPGIEIFTYGRVPQVPAHPSTFPARQMFEASDAIASRHELNPWNTFLVQQNPGAIDAGVFHNDVICVGNENILLLHEKAWVDQARHLDAIGRAFDKIGGGELHIIEVREAELPLQDAVQTYLFNSQIVTLADGTMALIAPEECRENPRARAVIDRILASGCPIRAVHFLSVRQSMRNGGGPACLRLRVVLTDEELQAVHPGVLFDETLCERLVAWVNKHYREELRPEDLGDVNLQAESRAALDELTDILNLRGLYGFQRSAG